MSTAIKWIIWLILTLLLAWVWFSPTMWYPCWQEVFCAECIGKDSSEAAVPSVVDPGEPGPLSFRWDNPEPFKGEGFDSLKASVMAKMTDDNILEITGLYHEGEQVPEGFANMGFARSAQVQALFPDIPADRLVTKASTKDTIPGIRDSYFEGARFLWVEPEKQEKESVEELEDRVIVRFPYNSTERISDPAIDDYLEKVAERVKNTGEQISLIGHTDDTGGPEFNLNLGRDRANAMKAILLEKGVPESQITVESKGESQAVASNATEAGKAENRRVEVRLIKQDNSDTE